jgi:hypothetical protein
MEMKLNFVALFHGLFLFLFIYFLHEKLSEFSGADQELQGEELSL